MPGEPFPEVGHPYSTAVSGDGRWLAVSCPAAGRAGHGRVAVYRLDDLALWDQLRLDQGVETLVFHPRLPVLAVGTEAGDEFERRGALHLYEPESRRRTGMAVAGAGVVHVRWRGARRLEVTFAEPMIDFADPGQDTYTRATAVRDDWLGVPAEDLAAPLGWPRAAAAFDWSPAKGPTVTSPQDHLAALAAEHGRTWTRRSRITVVEVLRDGRVLVAPDTGTLPGFWAPDGTPRTGTLLECWAADGTPLWSVPGPEDTFERNGGHLYVSPDEETAWVTTVRGTSDQPTTRLYRHALADGTRLAELRLEHPAALARRTDGAWVARDSRDIHPPARWPPYDSPVFSPSGRRLAQVPLGECDGSYDFRVRRSPHLLLLCGYGEEGTRVEHLEKWVVRISPAGVERLFPFAWDDSLGPYLRGGPAVYVDDAAGPGLVHACLPWGDSAHLVRRAFPGGELLWAHRLDAEVAGVDVHDGRVHAVTAAGELLTLDAADGTVTRRAPLALHGHTYRATCLAAGPDGELVIGTTEGRLLRLATP